MFYFGVLALAMGLTIGQAQAQENEAKNRAYNMMLSGIEMHSRGQHEAAVQVFDEALEIHPHAKIAFHKAQSLLALERFAEALDIYVAVIDSDELDDENKRAIKLGVSRCRQELAKTTWLRVVVEGPQDAVVSVNGKEIGAPPITQQLLRGKHNIEVERDGYVKVSEMVEIKGAPEKNVTIRLRKRKGGGGNTLAWIGVGSGSAMALAGLGLFGHYAWFKSTQEGGPGQELEGETLELVAAGALTGVGALVAIGSVFLFESEGEQASWAPQVYAFGPLPRGGAAIQLQWRY